MVGGPAHGPRAVVVEPAAGARPPVLVAFSQRKELPLAASQRGRNGAMVPRGDERQQKRLETTSTEPSPSLSLPLSLPNPSVSSVHIYLVHTWRMRTKKVARCTLVC